MANIAPVIFSFMNLHLKKCGRLALKSLSAVLSAFLLMPVPAEAAAREWQPDSLPGYERTTITMPDDYAGPVCATVVRRSCQPATRTAL